MKTTRFETTLKNDIFEQFNEYALNTNELLVIRGGDGEGEEDPNPEIIIEPEL